MEYVIVDFPESRTVVMDGKGNGKTNKTMDVEEGTHIFKLADPKDYKPRQVTRVIKNTTMVKPEEVIFEKK
ncbi:MAG: hypothetical protein A2283_11595 [Lentisphaerae bacterium RIFOXYA12_FULL_48_11]|nr:MAG: hypothetical protein A2283_11595 [Lentisphaerae bacterium RIFOXYA12_FULL_48_11]